MSFSNIPSHTRYNGTNDTFTLHSLHDDPQISPLLSIDPNRYAISVENNGKLLRPRSNHNQRFKNILSTYSASICCCVLPNTRTIPYYNFESTHFVYFSYKRHKLKRNTVTNIHRRNSSFCPNNYETQKRFSYFLLHITYRQLLSIDKLMKQTNNHSLFAEPFPQCLSDTIRKRGNELHSKYTFESDLLTKPTLPNGPNKKSMFIKKKSMSANDLQKYANYLHKILNNIQLLLNDKLYEILNINDKDIITLFKVLALNKLETLQSESHKYSHMKCMRDPTKLKKKLGIHFHTLWIVKRPLNDKNAAFLGCDHWALKFEGNGQLMTLGFFSYNSEHGIILTKIVPNTALNRRLFWYYWPRDETTQDTQPSFNTKWTVLERLYLGEITCELIGILIEEWLSYDNHAIYDLTHNNCQHFVRDFVAPLNIKIAKRLSSSFDVKVVKSLIPAGVLAEGIGSEAKCNNIHKRLWPILSEYQRESAQRKVYKKSMNEAEKFAQNFEFVRQQLSISSSEEEEAKGSECKIDMQDSLTIYKTHIEVGRHGNECYGDECEESGKHLDMGMHLTVTPSRSFGSSENSHDEKDKVNDEFHK